MAMCSILPLSTNSVVSVSCSVFLSSLSEECSSYSVKVAFNYLRSNLFSSVLHSFLISSEVLKIKPAFIKCYIYL